MCLVIGSSNSISFSGKTLSKEEKEKNKQDLQLLNEVWKVVTKLEDPSVLKLLTLTIKYKLNKNFDLKFLELYELCRDLDRVYPSKFHG